MAASSSGTEMDTDAVAAESLPAELLAIVFDFAAAEAVLRCAAVCRTWRPVALADRAWEPRYATLVEGKQFVTELEREDQLSAKTGFGSTTCCAFFGTIRDSSRTAITLEELCSLEFCFRFKSGAGESWTRMDPCAENTAQTRGYQQISAQSSMSRTRARQA